MTAPMRFAAPVTSAHRPSRVACRSDEVTKAPSSSFCRQGYTIDTRMIPPTTTRAELPVPGDEALQLSAALVAEIRGEIERAGGWLDFARYMELALYAPGLGYYSAGSTKLGAAGDFVTAPELGRSFGRALALTLDAELAALGSSDVVELGAGSGALA